MSKSQFATPDGEAWISTRQYDAPVPKKGEKVLIWFRSTFGWGVYIGEYYHYCKEWRPIGGNGNFNDDITHWMPLPGRPAGAPFGDQR